MRLVKSKSEQIWNDHLCCSLLSIIEVSELKVDRFCELTIPPKCPSDNNRLQLPHQKDSDRFLLWFLTELSTNCQLTLAWLRTAPFKAIYFSLDMCLWFGYNPCVIIFRIVECDQQQRKYEKMKSQNQKEQNQRQSRDITDSVSHLYLHLVLLIDKWL